MGKLNFLANRFNNIKLIFLLTTLISFQAYTESNGLAEFNQLFKTGQYLKALGALKEINEADLKPGQRAYYEGLSYSKIQEYDKAIKSFESAIKDQNESEDLQYEYGQASFAANELKSARRAFKLSIEKKYNVPASFYYVAHISQIVEEYDEAKDFYTKLIKNKDADIKMKQIARFQLSETLLMIMRDKVKEKEQLEKNVEKYIIPMMKQAYNTDKESQIAPEIDLRRHELEKEFNLDPNLLLNGKRISAKRYNGYLSQKIKFDDNISLTNEQNNVQQSKKESYVFETEVFNKYDFVLVKRFIISPELRINFVQHSDQSSAEVYQNDALSFFANIRNKYEHTLLNQPASFLFDFEYSKVLKDWNQQHNREAYSSSRTFGIGELFNFFSFGDTSIKVERKTFTAENTSLDNQTLSIILDQTAFFSNQHILIFLFEADYIDNINNTSTNTDTYLFRFDYMIPNIMPKYTLALALASTITDTKEQKLTRGTEVSLNPSINLSKSINDSTKISVNFDYTKSNSKQTDYDYQKSIISTELNYSF